MKRPKIVAATVVAGSLALTLGTAGAALAHPAAPVTTAHASTGSTTPRPAVAVARADRSAE